MAVSRGFCVTMTLRRRLRHRMTSLFVLCALSAVIAAAAGEIPVAGPNASKELGLSATVARALDRIRDSDRAYRLIDDLWFEKLPESSAVPSVRPSATAAFKSPASGLFGLADAVFDTHRLSWHDAVVPGLDLNVYKDRVTRKYAFEVIRNADNQPHGSATRTFGFQRRRLQMIMLPVMYKLGVITTLLTGLTVLSLKGVTIGMILLMLAITSIVAKVSKHHQGYAAAPWASTMWADPYDRSSQQLLQHPPSQDKNIHVHVHTGPGGVAMSPNPVYPMKLPKNPSPAYYDGSMADDNNGGGSPYYWNRANDEYYDAAANHYDYRHNDRVNRRSGDDFDPESTTKSVYQRWLG